MLITGGAGFIGSCLVRQLLAEGDTRVVNLDLLTYAGNRDTLVDVVQHPQHYFVEGDIADAELVARLLAEHRPQVIVHLAAESHVDRSIDAPRRFVETNMVGTFTLLEATHRYWRDLDEGAGRDFRFVHVSTDEVFGSLSAHGRFHEQSHYAPNSPYAASKASSDHLVRAYHQTYGLPTVITHSSNNYGPYQYPEKLVPLVTLNALDGLPLPVYGNGRQVRDWLHVDDHARALRLVAEQGRAGEIYCIGGDCEQTNLDVVTTICKAVDNLVTHDEHTSTEQLITFVADRPGHDARYAIDSSKIRRELGWSPTIYFQQGIDDTVRWYQQHRTWAKNVTCGRYHRERLGLG